MSSNWQALQQRLAQQQPTRKRKRSETPTKHHPSIKQPTSAAPKAAVSAGAPLPPVAAGPSLAAAVPSIPIEPVAPASLVDLPPRLALDCEMVGVGDGGKRSALARVVVIGFDERLIYSAFVKPPEPVTDYRTAVSGVRPEHMRHALPLRRVQDDVAKLLHSRIIIGHALHNDLTALMLDHPKADVRDTATYPPYRETQGQGTKPRRLKHLAEQFLGWQIQGGIHNPAEDAVAALRLYKLKMNEWERSIGSGGAHRQVSKWELKGHKEKERSLKRRKVKRGTGRGAPKGRSGN